jgi:glucose-1-phosphate cytidylyltransferase
MIVSILAGGLGTRLQEETLVKPKPMVEIGGRPILWHIMKIYASYGFREFVIALGYKGEVIKQYFLNYRPLANDLTISLANGQVTIHNGDSEDWIIHLIDTGLSTQIGGRVKRLAKFIGNETFMLTYGDGLSNINIDNLLTFHRQQAKLATVTAVRPPARFGTIKVDGPNATLFEEKPQGGEGWINGGFFVVEPGVVDYIENDDTVFEHEPLSNLSRDGQLAAYRHDGFWQCLDTIRDMRLLESMWQSNHAPWKVW